MLTFVIAAPGSDRQRQLSHLMLQDPGEMDPLFGVASPYPIMVVHPQTHVLDRHFGAATAVPSRMEERNTMPVHDNAQLVRHELNESSKRSIISIRYHTDIQQRAAFM
jgi:hypothetical protein